MIKHQYPSLFSPQSQEAQLANNLAQRTFELIDFIADKLPYQQQPLRAQAKIVLHESCSALREMNVAQNWRRVLKKLDHVEVSYPKNNQECCGFGGTFSVKSDAISAVMTQDKCHNLLNTQSDQIVSGDCGCLMNIGEHLKYDNKPDTCTHLASFLVEYFRQRHAP